MSEVFYFVGQIIERELFLEDWNYPLKKNGILAVFMTDSQRTGFDGNEKGRQLIKSLTQNTFLWRLEKKFFDYVSEAPPLSWFSGKQSLSVWRPNDKFLVANQSLIENRKVVEKNQLLKRYGKPQLPIIENILGNPFTDDGLFETDSFVFILENSQSILYWNFSEFGLHFAAFSIDIEHLQKDLLTVFENNQVKYTRVNMEKQLPVW